MSSTSSSVEWETLLFFAGLFVMVGALVKTGVIKAPWRRLPANFTHGDAWKATILILTVSFTLGSFINNVPYAAAMTPIVGKFADSMPRARRLRRVVVGPAVGHRHGRQPHRRWARAPTSSRSGIAKRTGHPVSFWDFTKRGAVSDRRVVCSFPRLSVAALLRLRIAGRVDPALKPPCQIGGYGGLVRAEDLDEQFPDRGRWIRTPSTRPA